MGSADVLNLGRLRRILTRLRKRNLKKFPLAIFLKIEFLVLLANPLTQIIAKLLSESLGGVLRS